MSYQYIHIEDPETLELREADDLTCSADEVVIDVAYAGITIERTYCSAWDFIRRLKMPVPSWGLRCLERFVAQARLAASP